MWKALEREIVAFNGTASVIFAALKRVSKEQSEELFVHALENLRL